ALFFQAEDGIRDWSVTGVQTCALPISPNRPVTWRKSTGRPRTSPPPTRPSPSSRTSRVSGGKGWSRSWNGWRRTTTDRRNSPGGDRKSVVEGKRGGDGGLRIMQRESKQ